MIDYQQDKPLSTEWLKEKHPQNIYKCSICGRLHEVYDEETSQTFVTFIGTILDGIYPSDRPSMSTKTSEPVTIIVCKRFRCVLEFAIGLLTLKAK